MSTMTNAQRRNGLAADFVEALGALMDCADAVRAYVEFTPALFEKMPAGVVDSLGGRLFALAEACEAEHKRRDEAGLLDPDKDERVANTVDVRSAQVTESVANRIAAWADGRDPLDELLTGAAEYLPNDRRRR